MAHRGLTGVLLVGGASSRFGSPKALARLGGETLAERTWRTLGEACDERLAVGKAGELELPFPVLDDGSHTRAPLAGIVAGLREAAHERVVFLPVDMPLVRSESLRALGEALAAADPGPLPAAFAHAQLPVLERRLRESDLRLRGAVAELGLARLAIDPAELVNVNEPADLFRLISRPASL